MGRDKNKSTNTFFIWSQQNLNSCSQFHISLHRGGFHRFLNFFHFHLISYCEKTRASSLTFVNQYVGMSNLMCTIHRGNPITDT